MPSTFFVNPRSNPELRSLHQIALLPQSRQIQDYFSEVMAVLAENFSIGYSALMLRDVQRDSLCVEGLYGVSREIHPPACSCRKGIIGQVLESRQPSVIQNLSSEPLYEEISRGTKRIDRIRPPLLCMPLYVDDQPFGVITIHSLYGPRDEFTEDFQFLSILSAILSPVVKDYQRRKEESVQRTDKTKAKPPLLEEVLSERLTEVLNRIDPYVESKTKMGLFDDIIAVVERILIRGALEKVGHVQVSAAQLLGINRNTLRKKIRDLKIKTQNSK